MRGDKNCILTLYYKTDVIKIYLISMINSKMILLKENSAPVRERERESYSEWVIVTKDN